MSENNKEQTKVVTLKERANSLLDGAKEVYHKHPVAVNISTLVVVATASFVAGRLTAPKKEVATKKEKK